MSRSARDSDAQKALVRHVEKSSTGCVSVGAGAAKLSIYLMSGGILASESVDDTRQILRMLQLRDALTPEQVDGFEAQLESSEPIFGPLLDAAPHEMMEKVLFDRFRQNIAEFVGSISKAKFKSMKSVFVENIQMGHNTPELISACCDLFDRSNKLDIDTTVVRSGGVLSNDDQKLVAEQLSDVPRTVSSLLLMVPMEPHIARNVLLDMVINGSAALDDDDEEDESDAPTYYAGNDSPSLEALAEDAQPTEVAPVPTPPKAADASKVPTLAPEPPPDPNDENGGAGDLSSYNAWKESSSQMVSDEELDFFSDHDYDRSVGQDGSFSTDLHNLDKVEVAGMGDDAPIEADEAPAAKFSAPVLSEDDARDKIKVANEVLEIVVKAFDEAEGSGRGRSVVQLLVDGSPSKFATILAEVRVTVDGTLPEEQVLDHLYSRPQTEHRQLIKNAMLDIIERALSSAADELPDEQFDSVFENVAGYRGRMGL